MEGKGPGVTSDQTQRFGHRNGVPPASFSTFELGAEGGGPGQEGSLGRLSAHPAPRPTLPVHIRWLQS